MIYLISIASILLIFLAFGCLLYPVIKISSECTELLRKRNEIINDLNNGGKDEPDI